MRLTFKLSLLGLGINDSLEWLAQLTSFRVIVSGCLQTQLYNPALITLSLWFLGFIYTLHHLGPCLFRLKATILGNKAAAWTMLLGTSSGTGLFHFWCFYDSNSPPPKKGKGIEFLSIDESILSMESPLPSFQPFLLTIRNKQAFTHHL